MHIGIDARMTKIPGGHGRYLTQLITHLQQIDTDNQYTLFVLPQDTDSFSVPKHWRIIPVNIPWYGLREQLLFSRAIYKSDVELMHFPHWNVPLNYRSKFIVTIHDLTLLHYPSRKTSTKSLVTYWIKQWAFKKTLRSAATRAQHIITPSEHVRDDVIKTLGVSPTHVTCVYEGAPEPFDCNQAIALSKPIGKNNIQIQTPYVLYVGVAYPHKNLDRLIQAFVKYKSKNPGALKLVLAGKSNYFYKQLKKQTDHQDILFLGEVTDAELDSLYCNATALAYVSLSEGFGLPPLEALAHDIPVLASNTTCLPEILGNSAIFIDPLSTSDIAQGIHHVTTQTHNQQQRQKRKNTLAKYNWKRMAKQTLKIYTS